MVIQHFSRRDSLTAKSNKQLFNQQLVALKHVSMQYKNKMASNFRRYKNNRIQKLKNLKHARPKDFWKIINSTGKTEKQSAPLEDLYNFFKTLNSENNEINSEHSTENFTAEGFEESINDEINQPFSEAEILKAVKNVKNNKSSRIDGILNEHIKSTIHIMCPVYVKLFNLIYDTGLVPESWTVGNILSIYKNKGNINLPENYRPITLLSCFGKLFTAILNSRLTTYMEETNGIDSCQAGFRKGFSTTDNLFILHSLLELSKSSKNKLHCAFVDFKQAFDTVWRNGLWQKLLATNINGKCYRFIRNMYCNIKSRIITSEGTSAFFPCQTGVRQGENLSPLLFSIYLNDLRHYLQISGLSGVECETANDDDIMIFIKLFILLFADDTVLFSNSKEELQRTLDSFETYCDTWHLKVNISKTKIVIFSNRPPSVNTKFYFKGQEIEIVKEYKYLGIYLSRSGSFLQAKRHLVDQANNALFALQRKIRILNLPLDMQIYLFDKVIKPILLYSSEIWGYGNLDIIERCQLKFYKQILNLKKSTPTFMVYGELGTFPLYVDIQCRMVSFWAKLRDGHNEIASTIYDIVYRLREQGKLKSKWIDHVQHLINSNGFGHVWNSPDEINMKWFIAAFKQKIRDQYLQTWSSLVDQASSGKNYRLFKGTFQMNRYFSFLPTKYCRILTAYRTRNHRLPIETGRWSSIPASDRICQLCNADIGDEYHYIMQCPFFLEQRRRLIKPYFTTNINTLKFHELMNHNSKRVIKNLSLFIEIIIRFFRDR